VRTLPRALTTTTALVLLLAGCGESQAPADRPTAHAATTAAPAGPPLGPALSTRLTLVGDATTTDALAATERSAASSGADATTLVLGPDTPDPDAALAAAAAAAPDVVVVLGTGPLDVVDRVSAQDLDQAFLLLGAQLPEPTENVTAVVWPGADSRWASTPPDPAALAARVTEGLDAGLAAIDADGTGGVLPLDG
jgi:basic membrane lipoprotein Med (substrate-binding protein (PBP1-ABC) superfamily)